MATLPIGPSDSEGGISASPGSIWMATGDTTLSRIDAATNHVVAQYYGRGGDAVHFGYGTVWLVNYNDHFLWRIKP